MRRFAPFALVLLAACHDGGLLEGWAKTPPGDGPRIAWDLEAEPLPDIPFPNDVATRPDAGSPTGRRLNASRRAPTRLERTLRDKLAQLDGFGTSSPLWVKLEARLDLARIAERQRADAAFDDDVVLLLDVTPGSPEYGEARVLDFGNGNFPVLLDRSIDLFDDDARSASSTLVFETYDEDVDADGHFDVFEDGDQDGALDPGEDQDGDGKLDASEDSDEDGVFDRPNTWGTALGDPARNDAYEDLVTFYELESETLIFRPVVPLLQRTTYAVVLLRDLVGVDGEPVRSPFPYVHHLQQRAALAPIFSGGLLERYGKQPSDVAFAWTFTTQSITDTLVAIREGLWGYGPLAHLEEAIPPDVVNLAPMTYETGPAAYMMTPEQVVTALDLIFERIDLGFDTSRVQSLIDTYGAVAYIAAGDYEAPDFLEGGGGDGFDIDLAAGRAPQVPTRLRFLMVVPRHEYGQAPFPVALYCHGYKTLKLEALAFAGVLAKFGIATFVIDAYHHGVPLGSELQPLIDSLLGELDAEGLRPFFDAVLVDRAEDLNGDGFVDVGGDFWTTDIFHTRDIVRQTVSDYLAGLRVLRHFDGERLWAADVNGNGLADDLAGDFDGDGQVDVGGPAASYFSIGTSMGGIISTALGSIEPAVKVAAPISPGGGLADVGLRTVLGDVRTAALLPILGPMLVAEPIAGDPRLVNLYLIFNDVFARRRQPVARVGRFENGELRDELRPGDRVRFENLVNGEVDEVVVRPDRHFRAQLAADVGDALRITVLRPDGSVVMEADRLEFDADGLGGVDVKKGEPLTALGEGLGLRRNTPGLRRMMSIAQAALDPGDPVNYARLYSTPEPVRPEGARPVNVAFYVTMGDNIVPVSSGIAVGRASGIIGHREPDPRFGVSQNELLIRHHVVEAVEDRHYFEADACHYDPRAVNFDIDDLSDGRHPDDLPRLGKVALTPACEADPTAEGCGTCVPLPALRATVAGPNGISAVRFPALGARGTHAIDIPNPGLEFDPSMFVINQIGLFFRTGGTQLNDHPCLAKSDCRPCAGEPGCPDIPPPTTFNPLGE